MICNRLFSLLLISSLLTGLSSATVRGEEQQANPQVGVGAQYDTTHVYVAPEDVDKFVSSFLATFGGKSTKQVVATVTPTPSSTTSQLLQTPVGTVSVFGFKTPVPYPFGAERTGYLVTDMDEAIKTAKASGADVLVTIFPDPIGLDAVIQWQGGVNMQLYWHTTKPSYAAFETIPENRVYVSPDRADAFTRGFLRFSHGKVVSDDPKAPGVEIGRPEDRTSATASALNSGENCRRCCPIGTPSARHSLAGQVSTTQGEAQLCRRCGPRAVCLVHLWLAGRGLPADSAGGTARGNL